jgi:hypothetical protein
MPLAWARTGGMMGLLRNMLARAATVLQIVPPRRRRNARVIALLDEWLADKSGYDEWAWPIVRDRVESEQAT